MQNRHPADRLADASGLRSRDWRPKRRICEARWRLSPQNCVCTRAPNTEGGPRSLL